MVSSYLAQLPPGLARDFESGRILPDAKLMRAKSLSHVRLFATLWTIDRLAPLSMGVLQARTLEWVVISSPRGSS